MQGLRREARRAVMVECHKHEAAKLLRAIPYLGPMRAAVLIGRVQTPYRFRSKRQFWAYCGLGLETRSSADYVERWTDLRPRKPVCIRGLNLNHNHDLKNVFKSAATTASAMQGPFPRSTKYASGQGNAAGHGPADAGAQDRRDCLESLEERRTVQRRATEAASSVSAPLHRGVWQVVTCRSKVAMLRARVRG